MTTLALTRHTKTIDDMSQGKGSFTESILIDEVCAGNEKAMEILYRKHKNKVFGVVFRIVGAQNAEEVTQEAFIRIFRGIHKFRKESRFTTWVYRLSVNAALTFVSKKKPHNVSDEVLNSVPASPEAFRDNALANTLDKALQELPPGYRSILVLHDVEGLGHEECASIMGCRVGTSKSQLHKARKKMREILNEKGVDRDYFKS